MSYLDSGAARQHPSSFLPPSYVREHLRVVSRHKNMPDAVASHHLVDSWDDMSLKVQAKGAWHQFGMMHDPAAPVSTRIAVADVDAEHAALITTQLRMLVAYVPAALITTRLRRGPAEELLVASFHGGEAAVG